MMAWAVFTEPMVLGFYQETWFLLPLCAAVGVVYKTIRLPRLDHLVREVLVLMVYMLAGLAALAAAIWAVHEYWP